MKDEKIRKIIDKYGEEEEITFRLFENPNYDRSIIGISSDQRVVYDYDLMIKEFACENECSDEEAREFIDYNTMRALPYLGSDAPIVIEHTIDVLKEQYDDYES